MSEVVIKVEEVSKQYRLGQISTGSVAHDVNRWWHTLRGKPDPYLKIGEVNDRTVVGNSDYVWALRDISFEVKQGEVLGIIGRNGAGKSTLLKILSRTTLPTTGSIKAKGRIASLLEVGTGFHPDLTGRENIFLNGAILGMKKREITSKFDEIVDFSGVEKYIDTPVKRYSSGMYVRLAFAVAAHLEPEILIVDEVLAVGDAEFQKKCLGKMDDVSKKEGRTVIFVSHSMGAVAQLCTKGVYLEYGKLSFIGDVNIAINKYLKTSENTSVYNATDLNKDMVITKAFLTKLDNVTSDLFSHQEHIYVNIELLINNFVKGSELRFVLRDKQGKAIFTSDYEIKELKNNTKYNFKSTIPSNFLRPGELLFTFTLFLPHQYMIDAAIDVISLKVFDGGSKYAASENNDYGYIFFNSDWIIS